MIDIPITAPGHSFKTLNRAEQIKEYYCVYGLMVFRMREFETTLVNLLKGHWITHQIGIDGNQSSREKSEELWELKYKELNDQTLGGVLIEFRRVYVTNEFDQTFDRLLFVRNFLIHQLMKSKEFTKSEEAFSNAYITLINETKTIYQMITSMHNVFFVTHTNPEYKVRWK